MSTEHTPYASLSSDNSNTIRSVSNSTTANLALSTTIQDHSSTLHLHQEIPSDTDHLSTTPALTLAPTSTPEGLDSYVVDHVAHVVKQYCIHQDGLANTDFVFQMTSWAISYITDDPFLCKHYFWLTIHHLYPHIAQWHDLVPQTFSATREVTTPPLSSSSSSQSSEAVSSPSTTSEVFSSGRARKLTMCHYCQRTFSRKDALRRHLKQTCTYTKEHTSLHIFSVAE